MRSLTFPLSLPQATATPAEFAPWLCENVFFLGTRANILPTTVPLYTFAADDDPLSVALDWIFSNNKQKFYHL